MATDKHDFGFGDYYCFRCGNKLGWDNDLMASEVGLLPEDTPLEDDTMVVLMTCPHCGLSYEVYDTPMDARECYPYWNEEEEEEESKNN